MPQEKSLLDKCSTVFIGLYKKAVSWIFFAIILFLFFLSWLSTTILVYDDEGGHIFICDNPFIFMILFAVAAVIFISLKNNKSVKKLLIKIKTDEEYFRKLRKTMLIIMGAISLFWVTSTQFIPVADQYRVTWSAYELHTEDYSKYQHGEYFEKYQNQFGIVLLIYFFSFFFGSANYLAFSLFNIAALLFFYYELSELCGDFQFGRITQLTVILTGFAFYPLITYTSYLYGTLCGLALGVAAMDMEMKYFKTYKKKYAVLSAVFIMLSVVIKSNFLIFLIAAAICAAIEVIRQRKIRMIALPTLIAVAALLATVVPKTIISEITGEPLDGGASSWGWIAMGLQEGSRAPGAFNMYNVDLYEKVCHYDSEMHAEIAKEKVKEQLKMFWEDKPYAVKFFTEKQAYQWSDPTFMYEWNIRGKTSTIKMSEWVQEFKSPRGAMVGLRLLNPMMTAVYLGALLYCLLCRNKINIYTLVLEMTFIGGFIFHTFWEAAPRYTLPYYVLLFPLAIAGYCKLADVLSQKKKGSAFKHKKKASEKKTLKETYLFFVPYICLGLVFFVFVAAYFNGFGSSLTEGSRAYAAWVEDNSREPLYKEGNYTLCVKSHKGLSFESSDEENAKLLLTDTPTQLRLVYYQGTYWFKFDDDRRYVALTTEYNKNKKRLVAAVKYKRDDNKNQWTLTEAGDGGVTITFNDKYVLAYDKASGDVYITTPTGAENEIWYLEEN